MKRKILLSTVLAFGTLFTLSEYTSAAVTVPNKTVSVTAAGAKANDGQVDNTAFQSTINTLSSQGGGTVEVPAGTFNFSATGGGTAFSLQSNVHLKLHANTVLKLNPNNLANHRLILISDGDTNVKVSGGQIVGERDGHTVKGGEWGHGIHLLGSPKNVEIVDTTIRNFWGDGVMVEGGSGLTAPDGLLINNITADNNRRQGLSITAGKNIIVQNSTFKNTNGTGPADGIDIERDKPYNKPLDNIQILHNVLENNEGSGLGYVFASSPTLVAKYNIIRNNHSSGVYIGRTDGATLEDNVIYNNGKQRLEQDITFGDGVFLNYSKNNKIIGNDVYGNARHGIYALNGVDGNQIKDNKVTKNTKNGIITYGGQNFVITGNHISGNGNNNVALGASTATQSNNGANVAYQAPAEKAGIVGGSGETPPTPQPTPQPQPAPQPSPQPAPQTDEDLQKQVDELKAENTQLREKLQAIKTIFGEFAAKINELLK